MEYIKSKPKFTSPRTEILGKLLRGGRRRLRVTGSRLTVEECQMRVEKNFVTVFGFFMLLLTALAFTACPNAGVSTGVDGEATVTFETNGGSPVASITVETGATIARPANPGFTFTGAQSRFRGWYTDNGTFEKGYDFTSRVLRDITLYADWGYRPGDPGPGGGKIFYRSDDGFTMVDDSSTAYYLEAALQDEGVLNWAPPSQGIGSLPQDAATAGYSRKIGGGRHNTEVILKLGRIPDSPAALACRNASHGGRSDWFLPSRDELNALFLTRDLFDNLSTKTSPTQYWTSNQFDYAFIWMRNFNTGLEDTKQNNPYNIRAVRAF